ncbi:FxLYD domain-containing protein [Halorientalis regularis]|uniref:FxLYD domain-containing protein n=1 Tax=Halorientalis regularis TaxID=660518 RepID=UPI000B897DE4|nr:FxLYD domain-containing protein [Halorientalis regularis]
MGLLEKFPGINEESTTRRKFLIGSGYGIGGLAIIGAAAGPQEESENDGNGGGSTDGNGGGSTDGNGGGGNDEESYPNAYYYDESTGIVLEDDIEAEADQIGSLYIRGTARNESGDDYNYVQVTFSVLDSSGAKIADALANTSGLEAGQSWRYEALAASADDVESYELQDIEAY